MFDENAALEDEAEDRAVFVAVARQVLEGLRPGVPIRFDADALAFHFEGGMLSLAVYWEDFRLASAALRPVVLARLEADWAQTLSFVWPKRWADAADVVMPWICSVLYLERLREEYPDPAAAVIPISRELRALVCLQEGEVVRPIRPSWLEHWGVSAEQLKLRAQDNLRERTRALEELPFDGVFAARSRSGTAASRMLHVESVSPDGLRGVPVVFVPHADELFVAGSEDTAGLAWVASAVQEVVESVPRPVSATGYVFEGGAWVPFEPPADSRAAPAFADARRKLWALRYGSQRDALTQQHEREGREVFVAKVFGFTCEDGAVQSICTWTQGVPTLLPQTDLVLFVDPDAPQEVVACADFDRVLETMGPAIYPERYLVERFPDAIELDQLDEEDASKAVPATEALGRPFEHATSILWEEEDDVLAVRAALAAIPVPWASGWADAVEDWARTPKEARDSVAQLYGALDDTLVPAITARLDRDAVRDVAEHLPTHLLPILAEVCLAHGAHSQAADLIVAIVDRDPFFARDRMSAFDGALRATWGLWAAGASVEAQRARWALMRWLLSDPPPMSSAPLDPHPHAVRGLAGAPAEAVRLLTEITRVDVDFPDSVRRAFADAVRAADVEAFRSAMEDLARKDATAHANALARAPADASPQLHRLLNETAPRPQLLRWTLGLFVVLALLVLFVR